MVFQGWARMLLKMLQANSLIKRVVMKNHAGKGQLEKR